MGLSGHAAGGAQHALLQLLAQRRMDEQLQQQEAIQRALLAQRATEHTDQMQFRDKELQAQTDDRAAGRRQQMNIEGLQQRNIDAAAMRPATPKRHMITTPGPDGGPMQRIVDEDDPELAAGIPGYRAPKEPAAPKAVNRIWVTRGGKAAYVPEDQVQPGDEPNRAPINTGDTAQDRQRTARVSAARGFLERLNELRERINTKMGPEAGLTGLVRRGAGSIGMDPDVAEYERVRAAGGRALAVAIMGAQNLSDQDANAWSNMLPGATVDRETAKRLTDQVARQLEGSDVSHGAPQAAGDAAPKPMPSHGGAPSSGGVQYRFNPQTGKVEPVQQ